MLFVILYYFSHTFHSCNHEIKFVFWNNAILEDLWIQTLKSYIIYHKGTKI